MNERLAYLFKRQLLNESSLEEKLELMESMADQVNETQVKDLLKDHWDGFDEDAVASVFRPGQGNILLNTILEEHVYPSQETKKVIRLWPRIAIAAAVIIVVINATLLFNVHKFQTETISYEKDIAPGKQGATLILSSGKKIKLSDRANGELEREAGIVITKSADGHLIYEVRGEDDYVDRINTLSTAKGETYQVHLPDGTDVWLNAASSLTYSAQLVSNGKRKVQLEGEGYFEVAKDKNHPFIVQSKGQEVEVLGTHFDINTYGDKRKMLTSLLEGSVTITANYAREILKPGQQAAVAGDQIQISQANPEQVLDWKNGYFMFENESIEQVMKVMSRWYDVEIDYDQDIPNVRFTCIISRNKSMIEFLRLLQQTKDIHFKIEGRRVTVMD